MLTTALFSFSIIAATLFLYQQFTKPATPNLISRENAIQTAIDAGSWNPQTLGDKKIEATLLHVKANGFSFVVDEKTLNDTLTLYNSQFPNHENKYLWIVSIIAPNNRYWVYTIDAATGELLLQPERLV